MSFNNSDQDPWGKPRNVGQNSENNQSNNGNNQSGWGQSNNQQSNNQQSPPNIEDIFNNLLKKLGGNGSNQGTQHSPKLGKLLSIGILVGVVIWGLSGLYTIKEAERGVVLRFGQLHSIVQPGLNWKPTFIDRVQTVNVEQVRELKTQGAMLTQDENMVKVEMTVQYRVQDPAKYLFSVTKADDSLNQATDSALRYVIGHMTMDNILTTGRSVVRENTWKALNNIIATYDMGLEVIDVNFQSARPPEEVKAAFDDAIKAQEDEQRYIREAEAYAREQEPKARGDAQRIVEQATAYKEQVVLDAQGEVERFQRLLPEFKVSPELLRERLYIQTMEKVMANTPKIMLDSNSGNNLTVLPLEQILHGKNLIKKENVPVKQHQLNEKMIPERAVINKEISLSNSSDPVTNTRQGRFN